MSTRMSEIGRTCSTAAAHYVATHLAAAIPDCVCAVAASLHCHPLCVCSWGTGWGENGYVRMSKQPWVGGPAGLYWQGIYSASRPVVKNGEPCVVRVGMGTLLLHSELLLMYVVGRLGHAGLMSCLVY